jgi:hypothetical protein
MTSNKSKTARESPRWSFSDIRRQRSIGRTTEWRIRQLPGHPKADALGRYRADEITRFYDSLTARQVHTARYGPGKGSEEPRSAELKAEKRGNGRDTPAGIPGTAASAAKPAATIAAERPAQSGTGKPANRPKRAKKGDSGDSGRA